MAIDVEIESQPITIEYEPQDVAASGQPKDLQLGCEVKSYNLLSDDTRPGVMERVFKKAIQKPTFAFDVTCVAVPEIIFPGQEITFDIQAVANGQGTDAVTVPDITISKAKLELITLTKLYATNENRVDSPKLEESASVATMSMINHHPAGPFSKEHDSTKTIKFAALPKDLLLSFSVLKFSRIHKLRLELHFRVTGEDATVRKDIPVRVVPEPSVLAVAVPGPSSGRVQVNSMIGDEVVEEDRLPAYTTD